MKKSILRLPSKILILCTIFLALTSCKCVEVVSGSEVQNVQMFRSVDTIVVHDSVFVRDSLVYREITRHDTVYITKEVYRDASHSTLNAQHSSKTDTIRETKYITQTIEHPPERYVPKFYKHCTIYFWCAVVLFLLYIVSRLTKFRLRMR